ncbi:MAG TPA: substrate-binding domain-containing protein [Solirubrobacteraceae bacterium]|nr:substrate-binding domain-containing protein [Solirubrobacteraceae bacterium]
MSLLSYRALEDQDEPLKRPLSAPARSRTIGVLSFDPSPYGKATVLSGIHDATRENDYCVIIADMRVPGRRSWRDGVRWLRRLAVDGILVLAPPRDVIELLAETSLNVPVVVVGALPQDVLSAVTSDHYAGAAAATRHLLQLGHDSVFHIAGHFDTTERGSRLAGWRDTLLAAGAEVPAAIPGDGSSERGYELGRRLAARPDVTAIFAASDQMALGVLRALSEARRRVPEEVSVIGFGGIPEGEFFKPPLTTVRQNFAEMGRRGAELLRAEIEVSRVAGVHETIPADLILRSSTAAPV